MGLDAGQIVAGKYELVRLLGRGSMGEVWVAHHTSLGDDVALKLLTQSPGSPEDIEDPRTAAARFLFEAQVASRLSKKTRHIVRVTDHGEEQGVPYLVMELLDGETLEAVLVRDVALPVPMVVRIVQQIARALTQAHSEGVLHRDLKPANVFFTRDEDGQLLAKLLDFGIARGMHAHRVNSSYSTAKGLVFGTPAYMSPEQARASAKLDHRCDLWALSVIAYEGLCGDIPIEGQDTEDLMRNLCAYRLVSVLARSPNLPASFDAFFRRAFSEAIGARFQSATELATAFEEAAGAFAYEDSAVARPIAPPPAPSFATALAVEEVAERTRRSSRARLVALGALGLVVAVLGIGFGLRALIHPAAAAPPASAALPPTTSSPVASATTPSPDATNPPVPSVTLAPTPPPQSTAALPSTSHGPPRAWGGAAPTSHGPPSGTAPRKPPPTDKSGVL